MNKIYPYLAAAALTLVSVAAKAQDLDPTVEVRRAYEGKLFEAHKPPLTMSVPDSLLRFDLDFDYSVFDSPYKGSYEFNPYTLAMAPLRSSQKPGRFHVRVGAGYELHPVLDLVCVPVLRDRFRMDVYASHNSFVGKYRGIGASESSSGTILFGDDGQRTKGYDFLTDAGTELRYDWYGGRLDFGASYFGLAQKDWIRKRGYDALDVNCGISSKSDRQEYFLYDVRAAYRYAGDKTDIAGFERFREHDFRFDATLGQVFGTSGTLTFDVGAEFAAYSGDLSASAGNVRIVPRYVIESGRWKFNLGVRLSANVSAKGATAFVTKGQYVYPDVDISVVAIPDAMKIYARVGGGERMNTMRTLLAEDRHFDFSMGRDGLFFDNSIERVSAVFGFEGRISTRFSYNLRAGYVNYGNMLFTGIGMAEVDGLVNYLPMAGYSACNNAFAALDWDWKAESIDFKGAVVYDRYWSVSSPEGLLVPAAFRGNASFTYNWKKRLYVGTDCSWSTSRTGMLSSPSLYEPVEAKVPGYADLGVFFEYVFNRKFSLWARGGNLLDMTILRSPLNAEGGINFTAGICLNL
ncbi:MAG: hypothetical protein ACI3ZL_05795 [Candidatus Cryptobacteroides sp.]